MIDIVREKSGKQNIIFIVDEVGQYVASRDNLILNLDGLAKNLKRLGDGKAWIISTAQQTLTEDDPRAALNSDKLYKLKDRFPIQIDLESSDIKEICYRRLLGKSPAGETELGKLFDAHGQACDTTPSCKTPSTTTRTSAREFHQSLPVPACALRHPAAPARRPGQVHWRHRPALCDQGDPGRPEGRRRFQGHGRSAGGLACHHRHALRRAGEGHSPCLHVHPPGGWQGTDSLPGFAAPSGHREVRCRAADPGQPAGVGAERRQPDASVRHCAFAARHGKESRRRNAGRRACRSGEKDGNLVFLSEKLRDIEQERGAIALRTVDVKRIFNDALRESFDPLPRVSLHGTMAVARA
jgi:hypothetical protein